MKIYNKALGFLVGAVLLINAAQVSAETFSPQHEQVKKRFQSSEEKTAKDAIWTQRDIFKVGVINEERLMMDMLIMCVRFSTNMDSKAIKVWVQVIDIVKLTRNGDWVKLGESHCQ